MSISLNNATGGSEFSKYIAHAEDFAEDFLRHTKKAVPKIGRALVVATFIDDGLRMYLQWTDQMYFMTRQFGGVRFLAGMFIIFNLVAQLVASGAILLQKKTVYASMVLAGIIVMQAMAYSVLWNVNFFLRSFALIGGLVLLVADHTKDDKHGFAGVPEMDSPKTRKNYLQLFGRILLVLMFVTLVHGEQSASRILFTVVGGVLVLLVAIGYKTKLSALVLAFFLIVQNVMFNSFWMLEYRKCRCCLHTYGV
eukprot:Colp12_sorted_trinity150504_noHs@18827